MKKGFIALIVVGGVLLTAGAALLITGIVNEKVNRKAITNTYDITEEVKNFHFDITTADVSFKVSEDATSKVICHEREKEVHDVTIADGTLSVTYKDNLAWYERWFDFNSSKMSIEIYLPSGNYNSLSYKSGTGDLLINKEYSFNEVDAKVSTGDVNIYSDVTNKLKAEASTGHISLSEVSVGSLELKASTGRLNLNKVNVSGDITLNTSTGRMTLEEINASNLTTNCSTGDVKFTNVNITNNINITTSTGDVTIVDSDASTVDIHTRTGEVNATFLTDKIVYAETSTGEVNVPHLKSGGLCNIKTSTGDITVRIKG